MFRIRTAAMGCLIVAASMIHLADRAAAQEAKNVASRVESVTLYRGQALVTRRVDFEVAKESVEVVVPDLPEDVVNDSLFAEGNEAVEIRAVRFRSRAVGEAPREEVRKLDEQIEVLTDQVALNQQTQQLLAKRTAYLDKLEGFVAPTAKLEASKGVLNADSLMQLTEFTFKQRADIAVESVDAMKESRELQKQLSLLQRQRAALTTGTNRTVRDAVLYLESKAAGKQSVNLSYLVNGCGWSPSYTYRADEQRMEVRVEYNALIQQMSGEDWKDVDLTLSTASPALSSAGPGLAPFNVALTSQPSGEGAAKVIDSLSMLRGQQRLALQSYQNALGRLDNLKVNWDINALANAFQCQELIAGKDALGAFLATPSQGQEPSLSYRLGSKVNLASRSDQQMVRILQTGLESQFYYVATPVLTSYVYREAELTNTSQEDLLGGPITVYLDGRFVGRSEIGTVARGQKFVVGFGADPQVRARRELADKTEKVQGGNRELAFEYRLVTENYKDEAVNVRVFDRLPHSNQSDDIRVTLGDLSTELSKDVLYARVERPKGILRWDAEVPGGASAEKAHLIEY
ncbi:MAG: mucoidy inhibitor MuiA family protein, partial [Planctomycetes bacterium]|nr:mucoidy inhibitor MuiA family protein [Planctomycetota bacterium]